MQKNPIKPFHGELVFHIEAVSESQPCHQSILELLVNYPY